MADEYQFSISGAFTYTYTVEADSPDEAQDIAEKYLAQWDYAEPRALEPDSGVDLLQCDDNVWETGPDLTTEF